MEKLVKDGTKGVPNFVRIHAREDCLHALAFYGQV